jgi:hypothetical protein
MRVAKDASYGFTPEILFEPATLTSTWAHPPGDLPADLRGPNTNNLLLRFPEFNERVVIVDPYRLDYARKPQAVVLYIDMTLLRIA